MSEAADMRQTGFTLIELLVSLAILSLVATLLLGGVAMARQLAGRMQRADQANESVIAAQTILRDRVEHLQAIPRADRADPVVDIQGDEHVFSFYAPSLSRNGPAETQAYRLLRMATGDLVLFSASSLAENVDIRAPSLIGWSATRLLSGTGELSLAYFAAGKGVWQRYWFDQPQPPQLIRVRVHFPAGDARSWPDLVIRPQVTLNTACRIDRMSGRCDALARP